MSDLFLWILLAAGVGVVIAFLAASIKVLREWERGVILRLGRLRPVRGPGLTFIIPIVDRLYRVDLRVVTLDVTQQRVITHDNVSVEVDAVVFYQVKDAAKSVVAVENFQKAAYLSRSAASSLSASDSSMPSTRLAQPARMVSISLLSCRISRETLSGRSAESTTPRTKRR